MQDKAWMLFWDTAKKKNNKKRETVQSDMHSCHRAAKELARVRLRFLYVEKSALD